MPKKYTLLPLLSLLIISASSAVSADFKIDKKGKTALLTIETKTYFRQQALKALLSTLKNAGQGDASADETDFVKANLKSINTDREKFTWDSENDLVKYSTEVVIKKVKHPVSSEVHAGIRQAAADYLIAVNAAGNLFIDQPVLRGAMIKKAAAKHADMLKPVSLDTKKETVALKIILPDKSPVLTCPPEIAGGFTLDLNFNKKIPLKKAAEIRAGFERGLLKSGTAPVKGSNKKIIMADVAAYNETSANQGTAFITRGDITFSIKNAPDSIRGAGAPAIVSVQKPALIPEGSSIIAASAAGEKVSEKVLDIIMDDLWVLNFQDRAAPEKTAPESTGTPSAGNAVTSSFCVEYRSFSGQKANTENFAAFKAPLTGKLIAANFSEKPCGEAAMKITVELYPAYEQKSVGTFKSFRTFCIINVSVNGRTIVSDMFSEPGVGLSNEIAVKNSVVKCAGTASEMIIKAPQ